MKPMTIVALLAAALSMTACTTMEGGFGRVKADKTRDYGRGDGWDGKHLSKLVAGVWVDPDGCDHWIIDDGIEGYLSARVTPDGKPVCSGVAEPNIAVGPYKRGENIVDEL